MLVVRPVKQGDLDDLLALAKKAGKGMTSLPPCEDSLFKKILASEASFSRENSHADDYFLLVMEDTKIKRVVGTAGIYARTGCSQAFYAYRVMPVTHYSHSLNLQVRHELLHLTNDYTDCSEVGTLFLDPEYRGNGHWLAQSRYLLMGLFPDRFSPDVIASLRGCIDENNRSPFWDAIGKSFFYMEFEEADHMCSKGTNQFITELMPKHPIYTSMLPGAARKCVGKPHKESERAMVLLCNEGFHYEHIIDIFDGGPFLHAKINELKSVCAITEGKAQVAIQAVISDKTPVCNSCLEKFRVIHAGVIRDENGSIQLSQEHLDALRITPDERVQCILR